MEKRSFFTCSDDDSPSVIDGGEGKISCAMPIIAEGDVAGLVASVFVKDKDSTIAADVEAKLIQTAAGFLGRQLES